METASQSSPFSEKRFIAICFLGSATLFFVLLPRYGIAVLSRPLYAFGYAVAVATFHACLVLLLACAWLYLRKERAEGGQGIGDRTVLYFALSNLFAGGVVVFNTLFLVDPKGYFVNIGYTVSSVMTVVSVALFFGGVCDRHTAGTSSQGKLRRVVAFLLVFLSAGMACDIAARTLGAAKFLIVFDAVNRGTCAAIVVLTILRVCLVQTCSPKSPFKTVTAGAIVYGVSGVSDLMEKTLYSPFTIHFTTAGGALMGLFLFMGIAARYAESRRKMQSWNVELEAAVASRTEALLCSEAARREMLANFAHDLRSPAAAILGVTQLLGKKASSPEQAELTHVAVQRSLLLKQRLDDLFTLAYLEAGDIVPNRVRTSAAELIKTFFAHYGAEFSREGDAVRLSLDIEDDIETVEVGADFERLWQVFDNLVDNAAKYARADGKIFELRFGLRRDGSAAVFFLEDNGPGIAAGDLSRLFERSFMVSRSRESGSGLGLAIAKSLIEMHDGCIWAENAPRGGSRFSFSLPVIDPLTV